MLWTDKVDTQALDWLLEEDLKNPSIRYLALKQLQDLSEEDHQVQSAFDDLPDSGPIPQIMAEQQPEGFWQKAGTGYGPKYSSTVWQIILLAQLGADSSIEGIQRACDYVLDHARTNLGQFSMTGTDNGRIHCLQGNLCASLMDLGVQDDARLDQAVELLACSVTGDDFQGDFSEPVPYKYLRSGICGPGLLCSANNRKPCAWGAVKIALALAKIPASKITPVLKKAKQICVDFLLSTDPSGADYPHPYGPKPSTSWFKFGFPVLYVTDVLQILEVLLALGLAGDPRMENAIQMIKDKQNSQGRWLMEYSYNGKMSVVIEEKKMPSKWVTLRALRVLKNYYSD